MGGGMKGVAKGGSWGGPKGDPKGGAKGGAKGGGKVGKNGKNGQSPGEPANPVKRDAPLSITLPADLTSSVALQEYPRESIVLGTDGKTRKELYSNADAVLALLVGSPETDIEYTDDADAAKFPEVAEALKAHGDSQESLNIAICPMTGAWAVGLGWKWKNRNDAAKIAMATTLILRMAESGENLPDLEPFPEFAMFVGEVTA